MKLKKFILTGDIREIPRPITVYGVDIVDALMTWAGSLSLATEEQWNAFEADGGLERCGIPKPVLVERPLVHAQHTSD